MSNKVTTPIVMAFLGNFPALQLSLLIIVSFFTISTLTNYLPYRYHDLNLVAMWMNMTDVVICSLLAIFVNTNEEGVLTGVSILIIMALISSIIYWIYMF